jgi:hypothetical protein
MMPEHEPAGPTARDLAGLVASGEVSPVEVVRVQLEALRPWPRHAPVGR